MKIISDTYIYKKVGTCNIRADVYPATPKDQASPVVLWIHGGALINGTRTWYPLDKHQYYHKAGYTVVSIDYRLAPETKLPDIIDDIKDAIEWIRKDGPTLFKINPERIGVVGHSAGGYLSLMTGLFTWKPRAIISFYGYGDIIGDWYSKPDPYYCQMEKVLEEDAYRYVRGAEHTGERNSGSFYLYCRQNGLWPLEVGGHNPTDNPEFFKPYCPEQNIQSDYPPTLLLHGTADTDVPYTLSHNMSEKLLAKKVESKLITIPDGPHVFDEDGSKQEVKNAMKHVLLFLDKYV